MQAAVHKGSITFRDKQIAFEGPREFVEAMIARFARDDNWSDRAADQDNEQLPALPQSNNVLSERDLILQKKPKGHHEIIAVLAFALTQAGTAVFAEDDIRRSYIRAGERPPKVVSQALRDAKNKFEYVEQAEKRGHYRLTNHGDRVVRFDLPRGDQ